MDNNQQINQEPAEEQKQEQTIAAPKDLDVTGVKAPKKDTRHKTEDVMGTQGLKFSDFGLSKELQLGIYEKGYENPSPIQEQSIPTPILNQTKNGSK